jgi:hypothetical protein
MLVLIVFAPVIIGGAAVLALLLGAATAGAWEAIEDRPQGRSPAADPLRLQAADRRNPQARAA